MKTREKLIAEARSLFVRKGVENTTMLDIAAASEKGRRTIYTYFRSKKEIYNAVLEQESEMMVAQLKEICESDAAPIQKLADFMRLNLAQAHDEASSVANVKSHFKFDLRRMHRVRRMVYEKTRIILDSIIAEGVASGDFRSERCMLLRSFIMRCLNGVAFAALDADGTEDIGRIHDDFVRFVITDVAASASLAVYGGGEEEARKNIISR